MNMKKTALASAMLLSMGATSAQAVLTITVTTMEFYQASGAPGFFLGGLNTSVVGTMNSDSTGTIDSGTIPFFGTAWSASQAMYDDVHGSKGNWSGTSASGPFNYTYYLGGREVAVGMLFNWGAAVDIAVLQIFDCLAGTCTSVNNDGVHPGVPGTIMDNGPFAGQHATFKGITSDVFADSGEAVPVPAAVWLFGSGLVGLVGVARRKKQA
jgi:hypothetical protein